MENVTGIDEAKNLQNVNLSYERFAGSRGECN